MARTAQPKYRYRPSPIGIGLHCHVNKPDTKFNEKGLYHFKSIYEGEIAAKEKEAIDELVEAAFAAEVTNNDKIPKAQKAKWGKVYPYVEEEDQEGAKTGRIIFHYKQNAVITLPDGEEKKFVVGIRDAKDKEITENVFGGCTLRCMYKPRHVAVASTKKAGIRLDFCMVQLIKKAGGGLGFDEVEGGFVSDGAGHDDGAPAKDGDY